MAAFDLADWIYPDRLQRRQSQSLVEVDTDTEIGARVRYFMSSQYGGIDLSAGKNLAPAPGAKAQSEHGIVYSFNGAQQGNLAMALPSVGNMMICARVRATATQAGTPGQAFGVFASSGNQSGFGVGFNSSNQVGCGWLSNAGAGLAAYSPSVIGQWYDVYTMMASNNVVRSWINGVPATTSQSFSVVSFNSSLNEIAIGAQHRSSGFLRQGKVDIEWASILEIDNSLVDDDLAAKMFASGFPYNCLKAPSRLIFFIPPAGSSAHLIIAANSVQANTSLAAAIQQTHRIGVANSINGHQAGSAAIRQTHLVGVANSAQANTASPGSVSQTSTTFIVGSNSTQPNAASAASIQQTHRILTADSAISHQGDAAAIRQTHLIGVADSSQTNMASPGSVTQSADTYIAVANSSQANTTNSIAIKQTHLIGVADSVLAPSASSIFIKQTHLIGVADSRQSNVATAGQAGNYTPPTGPTLSEADYAEIVSRVLAGMNAAPPRVDTVKMNGAGIIGDGSEADPWRGVGVSP